MPQRIPGFDAIPSTVSKDPGLRAAASPADIQNGVEAARLMNGVIKTAMIATNVNADDLLTASDLLRISTFIRNDPALYDTFVEGHGDDEGNVETGFHLVQGDGGTLQFQGRNFVNTVADAIYHVGFQSRDGRFLNEDGNANERVDDVAGWLNYFVNGQNVVYGTSGNETLYSGIYSDLLTDAADELFLAGQGNDNIWAGKGNDEVRGGDGMDVSGGGDGDDLLLGQAGNDKLWGNAGADTIDGGAGNDEIGGGLGADTLAGGSGDDAISGNMGSDTISGGPGHDRMSGGAGNDTMSGDAGRDEIWGGDGQDTMSGGNGADTMVGGKGADTMAGDAGNDWLSGGPGDDALSGGAGDDTIFAHEGSDIIDGGNGRDLLYGGKGNDVMTGGAGRDLIAGNDGRDVMTGGLGADELLGWETIQSQDIFVFSAGDTGTTKGTRDVIKGFDSGTDRIDLTGFGGLAYQEGGTFSGGGRKEVRFDGDYVQIDSDGNGTADGAIELMWVNKVMQSDFLL